MEERCALQVVNGSARLRERSQVYSLGQEEPAKVDAAKKQFEFQNESGMVNQAAAAAFGRQIGAEYMLYGNFESIVKKSAKVKDIYYKFTLNLMELETGIIEWADEKEIRKISKRSLFGW